MFVLSDILVLLVRAVLSEFGKARPSVEGRETVWEQAREDTTILANDRAIVFTFLTLPLSAAGGVVGAVVTSTASVFWEVFAAVVGAVVGFAVSVALIYLIKAVFVVPYRQRDRARDQVEALQRAVPAIPAAEPPSPVTRTLYEQETVKIADLAVPNEIGVLIVRNKRFYRCDIEGPAVVTMVGRTLLDHCNFDSGGRPPEGLFLHVAEGTVIGNGVVVLEDCLLRDCWIRKITISGTKELMEQLSTGLTMMTAVPVSWDAPVSTEQPSDDEGETSGAADAPETS